MSLLDPPTPIIPVQDVATIARIRARHIQVTAAAIIALPATEFSGLLTAFSTGVSQIWDDPNPADILAAIGTSGQAVFTLCSQTVAFLESLKPGCTAAITAKIKPTVNQPDGSVTLA